MRMSCQLKSKSFAPRSGLLQKRQSATRTAFLWEARPAANADVLPAHKSKSFAPRSGLLQEEPKRQPHRFFVGAATRGECDVLPAQKQELRPEVGPPTEVPKAPLAPLFCGSRAPRRIRMSCQFISKSFAPRSGLLQKSQKRHSYRLCGRRASRRIQASGSLSRAARRSVRRARRSRRRRAETGYARLAPRRSSEPRPRLPPAAFQVAIR